MNTYNAEQAHDMWQRLQHMYDTPLDVSQSDDYITQMRQLSIPEHIGFDEDTVHKYADKLILLNSKLDIADRLNDTNIGNRILLAIMNSSSHLHAEARKELNASVPDRQFSIPPINANGQPNINAGHRDLTRLIHHFDNSWRDLIKAGYISKRGPSRPVATAATAHRALETALTTEFIDSNNEAIETGDLTVTLIDALNITTQEITKTIAADTPVTYHTMHDLPCGDATRLLLPRIQNALVASEFSCAEEGELQRTWAADLDREPLAVALSAVPTSAANLPTTIAEARKSKYWGMVKDKDAMEAEIKGKFIENQAWKVVPRTPDLNVIKSKWVLKFTLTRNNRRREPRHGQDRRVQGLHTRVCRRRNLR
mmetsp:Transcript_27268/g.88059  ORF Transcript_27268/g.88059 Transcript_27268/m.88059 type:complete len:369 (-) Transcript_27268:105-1211(-)